MLPPLDGPLPRPLPALGEPTRFLDEGPEPERPLLPLDPLTLLPFPPLDPLTRVEEYLLPLAPLDLLTPLELPLPFTRDPDEGQSPVQTVEHLFPFLDPLPLSQRS